MTTQSKDVQNEDAGPNLLALWHRLRKYWLTAAAVTVAVASVATFYTLGQKKIYRASATILFDPNPPRPLGGRVEQVVELGSGSVWDTKEYYETQYQLITSHSVALETVQQLGLHKDPAFIQNTPPGEEPRAGSDDIDPHDAASILRGRVKVEPVKGSRLAKVELEDADPARAAKVLGTLVDIYVENNVENAMSASSDATDWLHSQLTTLKGDLETSENELHDYKEENRLLSVEYSDKSNMLTEQMAQLNSALTEVKAERVHMAARYATLAQVSTDDPLNLPASEFIQNGLLSSLKSDYQAAIREHEALLAGGKGANHPEVKGASARVDTARKALLAEVRNIQGAVQRDLAIVAAREGGLLALFEEAKTEALELNRLEIDFNRLNRTRENNEKLYGMVMERAKEADLTRLMLFNNISVVDRPRQPGAPVRPRVPVNIAGGVLLGLLLGMAAAVGRGALDRTIKTPTDIEQRLKANYLGLIPQIDDGPNRQKKPRRPRRRGSAQAPELAVHDNPTGGVAEAARTIRTNLMFLAPDKPYRTLLVTSAGPADGKTTVACCIAVAMAQTGRRVLLLDCDLRRPRVHRIFGRTSEVGLTTALVEDSETPVFETGVPNLFTTVAGPIPPNPAEILQSAKFRRYLDDATSRYDLVVIDSPPLVAVTDAAILSKVVDGTLMVVRAHKTRIEVAEHGMRALTDVGANVSGVVLNAVDLEREEYYRYSYGYYRANNTYSMPNADGALDAGVVKLSRTQRSDDAARSTDTPA